MWALLYLLAELYEVTGVLREHLPEGVAALSARNNVLWHALLKAVSQHRNTFVLSLIGSHRIIKPTVGIFVVERATVITQQ